MIQDERTFLGRKGRVVRHFFLIETGDRLENGLWIQHGDRVLGNIISHPRAEERNG